MYNEAPEAGIASLLASRGRNGDSVLVHMAPEELSGLQQLAVAHGGTLTLNPVTGLYEASFLKKLLPAIIGAVLPSVPGLSNIASSIGGFFGASGAAASTLGTGLLVGGATALIEGDLKKGLAAGLGAYSGANIAQSLQAAAAAAPPVSSAEEVAKANQAVEAAKQTVGAEPIINPTVPSDLITPDVASGMGGSFTTPSPSMGGAQFNAAGDLILPEALSQPSAISGLSGIAQGAQNLFTNPNARSTFMQGLGGGFQSPMAQNLSRYATFAGVADAFTPEVEMPKGGVAGEDYIYMPGGFNPMYGTGRQHSYFLPGGFYKRTPQGLVPYNPYAMAPGYADGGIVNPEDAMMVNTGADPMYDMTGRTMPPEYNPPAPPVSPALPAPMMTATTAPQNPYDVQRQRYETMLAAPPPPPTDTSAVMDYVANLNRRAQNPLIYPYPGGGTGGTSGPGDTGNVGAKCGPGFVYDANLQRCVPVDDENEPGGPGAGDGSGGTGRAGGERGPGGGVSSGAGGGGFTGGGGRGGAGTGAGANLGSIFGGAKTPGEIATRALDYLEASGGLVGTVLGLSREVWQQIRDGKLDLMAALQRGLLGFVPDFIENLFKDKDKDKDEEEKEEQKEDPFDEQVLTAGRGGGEGYGGGISGGGIGGGWGMSGIGGGGTGGTKITIEDPITGEQIKNVARGGHIKSMQVGGLSAPPNPYGAAVGEDYNFGFAAGGVPEYQAGGKLLNGPGDGMSDDIPAVIRGKGVQRAALADGEFVVPADVVSHLGNGSTNAGAKKLYQMMAKVRQARTGKNSQAPAVNTQKYLPNA